MHVMHFNNRTLTNTCDVIAVVKIHDDASEGLPRRTIVEMVITASGGKLNRTQAEHAWDQTIHPLGKQLGLLTGYVKPQEGSSKRTAAGAVDLQKEWHLVCDEMFKKIKQAAFDVLQDATLVAKMMPSLIANLDEECVHALGKNYRIVGSTAKKKHDNQNASSRFAIIFFFLGPYCYQVPATSF